MRGILDSQFCARRGGARRSHGSSARFTRMDDRVVCKGLQARPELDGEDGEACRLASALPARLLMAFVP